MAVWRRAARALGVGVLSGGYGQDELERAGAYRVYHDPVDLLRPLDEVGSGHRSERLRHLPDGGTPRAIDTAPCSMASTSPRHAIQNVDALYKRDLTRGERVAIAVTQIAGSWTFIVAQSLFLAAWIVLNVVGWVSRWDPYPFILLNLVLNVITSYTAPLILMAQNRDAERDRLMMHEDFETNRQVAADVYKILRILDEHGQMLTSLLEQRDSPDRTRL